ncbi:MAG: sirohydrochlorin cobaltochelatase [Lachnospiraceae bacterium]|nr:sirohydrochlorin cobaltochelatase [Lachnospiraceae bacterium]
MAKKALLVVSFGSTHEDTIKDTITAAERDLALAFPDRQLYTAWTSRFIRKTMEARDRHIDSPAEAIERMELAGVTDVLVQPTLITANYEYLDLLEVLKAARGRFERIACGTPVITDEKDAADLAAALRRIFPLKDWDALVLMGHGTAPEKLPEGMEADRPYRMLQEALDAGGSEYGGACIVGILESEGGIEAVCEEVRDLSPSRVVLAPLLVTAGDHAVNDMSGEGEDSWKNMLRRIVPRVDCVVKGLAEYETFRRLYVEHAKAAKEL